MHQGELSMARNTGEYLNEALRGINLQVRDIMSDIVALNKLLFKR